MVINYHAGNLLSPALKSLCDKKLEKLEKFADDIVVDVFMEIEGKEHMTKMILKSKNLEAVAHSRSNDMYKNLDVCLDSIKTQIQKEKPVKKHSKHAGEKTSGDENE